MANRSLPISFTENLQLSSVGIQVCTALEDGGRSCCAEKLTSFQQSSIGFNSCTLESDNFVCVRQKVDENASPEVIIINLKQNNNVTKRPIKADSAIMHCEYKHVLLVDMDRIASLRRMLLCTHMQRLGGR